MSDNDIFDAALGKHFAGNLACIGALRLHMDVFCTDFDIRALSRLYCRCDIHKRDAQHDFTAGKACDLRGKFFYKRRCF